MHAWDVLRDPASIAAGSPVTIIGGGMVGLETADLLSLRGVSCTVVEALATVAPGMARNNRMELLDRLQERGTTLLLNASVAKAAGRSLELAAVEGTVRKFDIGDCLIIATGPEPEREMVAVVEAAGVDYALAGDSYRPGDFLSCLRDGWMVGLGIEHRTHISTNTPGAGAPGNQPA